MVPAAPLDVRLHVLEGRDNTPENAVCGRGGEIRRRSCVSAGVLRRIALVLPLAALCLGAGGCSNSVDVAAAGEDLRPWVPGTPVGFDDLRTGTDVTGQYPHATFSSDPGCACETSDAAGMAASAPNYVFTYYTCPTGATASVFVDFDVAVHDLSFKGVGVNNAVKVATIHVMTDDGVHTVDMVGQGDPTTPVLVDLSRFQHVTRLEIVDVNDPYGMGFDDFVFQAEAESHDSVPAGK